MPDYLSEPAQITVREAMSIAHCYITSLPSKPLGESELRYIWQRHEVDESDSNLTPQEACIPIEDFTVQFAAVASATIAPPGGLPPMTYAQIAAYIKQAGYDLLTHKRNGTGPFLPLAQLEEGEGDQ